jgi:hypothetical protein
MLGRSTDRCATPDLTQPEQRRPGLAQPFRSVGRGCACPLQDRWTRALLHVLVEVQSVLLVDLAEAQAGKGFVDGGIDVERRLPHAPGLEVDDDVFHPIEPGKVAHPGAAGEMGQQIALGTDRRLRRNQRHHSLCHRRMRCDPIARCLEPPAQRTPPEPGEHRGGEEEGGQQHRSLAGADAERRPLPTAASSGEQPVGTNQGRDEAEGEGIGGVVPIKATLRAMR